MCLFMLRYFTLGWKWRVFAWMLRLGMHYLLILLNKPNLPKGVLLSTSVKPLQFAKLNTFCLKSQKCSTTCLLHHTFRPQPALVLFWHQTYYLFYDTLLGDGALMRVHTQERAYYPYLSSDFKMLYQSSMKSPYRHVRHTSIFRGRVLVRGSVNK